jgi:NodT family efflux transporter outer membrane factor (OMF) lipoprotein
MAARRSSFGLVAASGLVSMLAACAVGPNFKRPTPPADPGYGSAPMQGDITASSGQANDAQRFTAGLDVQGDWWTLFRSPKLDRLIEQALKANSDISAAEAALRQAHELYAAQRAALWPLVQGNLGVTRSRYATNTVTAPTVAPTSTYSLYTAELTLSYVPDVFGGTRRTIEAAHAQAESSRFQLEAAYVTLTTNVVVTAVQEAALRGQIAATEHLLQLQEHLTETVRQQQNLGTASQLDLLLQQSLTAQAAATLPPLQKQLGQTRDELTALLGRLPAAEPEETFSLDELTLPDNLPVSLPSKLVEQRPDVRQAEENLHAASADVGVAVANMLPQFMITADTGSSALTLSQLLKTGNGFWDLGASLTQTLFDAGALIHKHRAAEAALDEAGAQYRGAVILACQNVADTLRALQADASALKANAEAARTTAAALDLARHQHELGTISFISVLTAEQAYVQAELALVQSQANRYSDTAGLFQALGGGWWNRPYGVSR